MARNLALLLSGKAAAGLLSLVFIAAAARILGPTNYGRLALIHGYTVLIGGLVNFPASQAIVRYGAPALRDANTDRLVRLMRFTARLELGAGALAVIVAAAAAPVIGPHVGLDAEAQRWVAPYSLAVFATVRTTPTGFLQLLGEYRLLGLHNMVNPLVRLVGTLAAWLGGLGLRGFLVAWLASALAECLTMWALGSWCLGKRIPRERRPRGIEGVRAENPRLLRFLAFANADATVADLSPKVALLLVGSLLGPAEAGLFAVAQRSTIMLAQSGNLLGQAAYPEFAHLVAAGGEGRALRRAVAKCVGGAMAALAPIVILVVTFPEALLHVFGGAAFTTAGPVVIALMAARSVRLTAPPMSAALSALGRPGLSVIANAAAASSLPSAVLLMRHHGLLGAGIFAVLEAVVAVSLLAAFALGVTARPMPSVPRSASR